MREKARLSPALKRHATTLLKVAISITILVLLFSNLDTESVGDLFANANVILLLVGGMCLIGQAAIASLKWAILLSAQSYGLRYVELFRIILISGFINLFMPGTVGGDAYRVYRVGKERNAYRNTLASVVVDRGSGVVALLTIGFIGVGVLYFPEHLVSAGLGLLVAFVSGYVLLIGPIGRLIGRLDPDAIHGLIDIAQQVIVALHPSRKLVGVLILSFVFQLNNVWVSLIYSRATDISIDLSQLLIVIPVAFLLEMVPISINGVGVREGTLTVLFGQMGLQPEHGLVLGLTISIMRYIAGLVGAALFANDVLLAQRS